MSLKRFFNRLRLGDALNEPGREGETYLTRAVKSGNPETVRAFLEIGADPDVKNKAGEVPLHLALCAKNLQVLHLLLETGADIFNKQHGLTLREQAEKSGMHAMARMLKGLEERKLEALMAASMASASMMAGAVAPVAVSLPLPRLPGEQKPAAGKKPSGTDSNGPR